jgi:hypothetical protein
LLRPAPGPGQGRHLCQCKVSDRTQGSVQVMYECISTGERRRTVNIYQSSEAEAHLSNKAGKVYPK